MNRAANHPPHGQMRSHERGGCDEGAFRTRVCTLSEKKEEKSWLFFRLWRAWMGWMMSPLLWLVTCDELQGDVSFSMMNDECFSECFSDRVSWCVQWMKLVPSNNIKMGSLTELVPSVLVVYTASLFLKWVSSQFQAEYSGPFQHDGYRLQWLSTQAHSGLMSTVSLETAWCEQRGGIFMPLIKGLESLEMQWVVLSSHNGNNYQTEEARFWNKVWFTIQLTLGCPHQIPRVSMAERLSVQLGPVPNAISNAAATFSAPLVCLTLRRILMQARRKCALCREPLLNRDWITQEPY